MNNVVAYIHLILCIGWTILWLYFVPPTISPSRKLDLWEVLFSVALWLTTASGIYLFAVGRNSQFTKLQKLRVENSILEKQIEQAKLRQQLKATEKT